MPHKHTRSGQWIVESILQNDNFFGHAFHFVQKKAGVLGVMQSIQSRKGPCQILRLRTECANRQNWRRGFWGGGGKKGSMYANDGFDARFRVNAERVRHIPLPGWLPQTKGKRQEHVARA